MVKASEPRASQKKSEAKPVVIGETSDGQIPDLPAVSEGDGGEFPQHLHPEEMRATVNVRFGNAGTLEATARCTPAGLVAAGLMVSGVLLSVASVVWASRRSPR